MTIEWKDWPPSVSDPSKWKRATFEEPGHDCRVECKHEVKGDHGICSSIWVYLVTDGECTLALDVYSGIFPPTVERRASSIIEYPNGRELTLHVPWVCGDNAEEDIQHGRRGRECELIPAGRCWMPHSSSLGARDFWRANYVCAQFQQPETFWEALRAKAEELIKAAREHAKEFAHLKQCPTCRGRGVIEVPQ